MITAGEVLKNKREALGKDLGTVSADTKIQKGFIEHLENDRYEEFDSEVFLTGFLKIYSSYLGLDTKKILALYRRSNPSKTPQKKISKKEIYTKKKIDLSILTPKTIITSILTLFLLTIFTYIGIQIYKFQTPPELEIAQPENESVVNNEEIEVKGITDKNNTVDVNGRTLEIGEDGSFNQTVELKEGVNIITIKAKKNNNTLETVETRKVTLKKEEEAKEEPVEKTKNTITLEVTDTSTWIKLDIDEENKLSQIVPPSKTEYEIENKLHIIVGRTKNTKLLFNNTPINLESGTSTGVAELNCIVQNEEISCE